MKQILACTLETTRKAMSGVCENMSIIEEKGNLADGRRESEKA